MFPPVGIIERCSTASAYRRLRSLIQIRFHPYNYADYAEVLKYSAQYDIVTEAYGSLAYACSAVDFRPVHSNVAPLHSPITTFPNGPLTPTLARIAKRLSTSEKQQATPAQVIFKWVQAKGAVIVTTSGKKERLEEYLAFEDLRTFFIAPSKFLNDLVDDTICSGFD